MQLKTITLSTTLAALLASQALMAEDYVSIEYLQYNENDSRVSVSAPTLGISYDIGTDYNIKLEGVHDAVSGATPIWQPDTQSGASARSNSADYRYGNAAFDEGRNAASLMLTTRFENRDELYVGFDYSRESDFDSKAGSLEYMHYTDESHNRALNIGASFAYNDILTFDYDTGSGASVKESATSINLQAGIMQVLSAKSLLKLEGFAIRDQGYLNNAYANVIRHYATPNQKIVTESRPDTRLAYGINFKYTRLMAEDISYGLNYRFYQDDWEILSHTIEQSFNYQWSEDLLLSASVRYYTQSQASFYHIAKDHFTSETYASSDKRLSDFDALTYKGYVEYQYNDSLSLNLGAEFYTQSTGLDATLFTTGVKYRF